MSEKNKVKLFIAGSEYMMVSDDSEEYIKSLGEEVDGKITQLMESNSRLSPMMASILAALDYCDQYKKALSSADNLRSQIKDYLEDSARARIEADEARREIERLTREVQALRARS